MVGSLKADSEYIIDNAIKAVLPEKAVELALKDFQPPKGRLILVAIGKAAYRMARSVAAQLPGLIDAGIVITKYGHAGASIDNLEILEAGHPISDKNTYSATKKALELTQNLSEDDLVLFLVSGGGSALFEKPLVSEEEWESINSQLLACGADIREINAVRKRLSSVKGGKFAKHIYPASCYSIVLSDVIGNDLSTIASGPAYPDSTSPQYVERIIEKYNLALSDDAKMLLHEKPVTELSNVSTHITGSVTELVRAAADMAEELGYEPYIITDSLCSEAASAGIAMARRAIALENSNKNIALIEGGETVVVIKGNGRGGRNQEYTLSAAEAIAGKKNICIFSVGSDGTDGPTDAAGGYVDADTAATLKNMNIDIKEYLDNNDSYNVLKACGGLIITGPTGTNVNDVAVALIRRENEE